MLLNVAPANWTSDFLPGWVDFFPFLSKKASGQEALFLDNDRYLITGGCMQSLETGLVVSILFTCLAVVFMGMVSFYEQTAETLLGTKQIVQRLTFDDHVYHLFHQNGKEGVVCQPIRLLQRAQLIEDLMRFRRKQTDDAQK